MTARLFSTLCLTLYVFLSAIPLSLVAEDQPSARDDTSAESDSKGEIRRIPRFFVGILTVCITGAVIGAAKSGSAKERNGRLIVRFGFGMKLLAIICSLFFAGFCVLSFLAYSSVPSSAPIGVPIGGAVVFLFALFWTLHVCTSRIEFDQSALYLYSWIAKRRVFWKDLTSDAIFAKWNTSWTIQSAKGKPVRISQFMTGHLDLLDAFETNTSFDAEDSAD